MNNKGKEEFVGMIVVGGTLLFVIVCILIGEIIFLNRRITRLETKENSDMTIIHNRVTNIAGDLQSDINNVLDWTEENSAKISEIKGVISNTNGALKRVNKQLDNKEDKKEEVTETPVRKSEPIPNSSKEDVEMTEIVAEDKAVEQPADNSDGTYLGYYTLTAYEATGNTCANGNWPTPGYTVACNSIPLGTTIYIEGYGTYVVEDTGGMGGNVIDIYMGDVESCYAFGVQGANVYIVN